MNAILSINITDNPLKRIMGKVPMKTRAGNLMVEKRAGGGVVFSREGGKHLNLQSASALSALGIDKVRRYAGFVRLLILFIFLLIIIL